MVAINFMHALVPPILAKTKIRTLRNRNRFQVGDTLQLYTGMRHKTCRLLAVERCMAMVPVEFSADEEWKIDGVWLPYPKLDVFARNDGFKSYAAMREWFMDHKGPHWQGWLVAWGDASYLNLNAKVK